MNKLVGSSIGPFEAWLALRGLKTLSLRMRQQCDNALTLATWLQTHPKVGHVNYAFLPDHPQYELLHRLTGGKGGGGVFSFEILGAGLEQVFAFMDALDLIQPATSLGDIYSLVLYPAISSKIDIGAVHDVEGTRFGCDLIENVDVMDFPVCDVDKRGNVAVKIQQCMHLDRGFVPAKPGPWE